jgi:hypothetical protein
VNIVRLDTEQTPSPSGGGELVMADAGHLFVVFVPMRTRAAIASKGHNVAVATFVNYAQMTFGYPTKQNRIAFPDKRIAFNRRHFLMPFKETTLHVLASELAVQTYDEPFTDVAMGLLRGVIRSEVMTVCPRIDE